MPCAMATSATCDAGSVSRIHSRSKSFAPRHGNVHDIARAGAAVAGKALDKFHAIARRQHGARFNSSRVEINFAAIGAAYKSEAAHRIKTFYRANLAGGSHAVAPLRESERQRRERRRHSPEPEAFGSNLRLKTVQGFIPGPEGAFGCIVMSEIDKSLHNPRRVRRVPAKLIHARNVHTKRHGLSVAQPRRGH